MKNIINLSIGDPSHDGHSKSDIITIESNFNKKQIEEAYTIGVKTININLIDDIASEYEDHYIPAKEWKHFIDAGFECDLSEYAENKLKNDKLLYLDEDLFARLYLFIVKLGNPKFEYKIINSWDNTIEIGGYGLFSC